MVKMAVGAATDTNANPGLKKRSAPAAGVAPAMLVAPGLSGPGLIGAVLRVDPGVWGGVPAPVVTPRWRRNGVDMPGATAPDYVPGAADDGAELRCVVTASNASGTASTVTDAVRITYPAPVVAGALGDLVLDQGEGARTLDASAAFTGAALVFGVDGAGASADPATGLVSIPLGAPRASETVTVTATNSGGSASVSFTVTVIAAPVLTPPVSTVAPSLSGSGRVGTLLRVDTGTWSGDPTPVLSLRWRRNGAEISGATGAEYTPVAADEGADLDCLVTAVNAAGSAEAATGAVRIVHVAPMAAGALADRVLDQGQGAVTLDASAAFTGAALTFGVTGAGATIDPATGILSLAADTPRAGETVTVTATNSGGSASVSFTVTVIAAPVLTAPASLVAPSLSGSGRVGAPMRVEAGTWSGDPTPVLSLRWRRNGAEISGATGAEYTPVAADEGADLDCLVTAVNAAGSAEAATGAVRIVHAAPSVLAALPDAVFGQGGGTASLPTAQGFAGEDLTFGVTGAGATIDPATGWISLGTDLPRVAETVTVTATNSGGSVSIGFTVTVTAADTTAPVLTAGAFDAAASPATLSFTADEGGTAFWMVDGAATRDAAEVEAGGGAAAGVFAIGAGATVRDVDLGALTPGAWNLHLMVRDAAGNRSGVISTAFDLAPADLAAPVLSGMAVTPGPTGAALSVSTDEAGGALYWMVDAAAARSAEEIRAGGGAASGSRAVSAAGPQAPLEAAGLSPATGYRFHVMHEDAAGNRSAPIPTAFVTTSPATGGGIRVERSAVTVSSSGGPAYAGSEFVVGDAADRVLVALVHGYSTSAGTVPGDVAISFGGVAMTPALAPTTDSDLDHREWVAAYVLAGPASGPGALALNWSLSTRACAVTLVELSGVDQAAPVTAGGVVESGVDAALAFTRPAAAEGSLLLSALAINSGGRGAAIGVTGGATELRKGDTGPLATSDVSFAVASQTVVAGGPKGHGYAWPTADRAILGWLEMKEA